MLAGLSDMVKGGMVKSIDSAIPKKILTHVVRTRDMTWTLQFHPVALEEMHEQPGDIRAKLERIEILVEAYGLTRIPGKYSKHLTGELWEFRLKGKDGIARAIYVTRNEQRIIVLRVFTKKTQKTPPGEISIALRRAQEAI